RAAPPGGVRTTVTRFCAGVPASNPGELAWQTGSSVSLTKSPGRANGRSVLPSVLRKVGVAGGMMLHAARATVDAPRRRGTMQATERDGRMVTEVPETPLCRSVLSGRQGISATAVEARDLTGAPRPKI